MRLRPVLFVTLLLMSTWGLLFAQKAAQRVQALRLISGAVEYPGTIKEWREYQGEDRSIVPPDYRESHDWVEARLMYKNSNQIGRFRGNSWTTDYPAGDRSLIQGVRRLTRIDARSVEQPVELDGTGDVFNWPFLYAVEVGHWAMPEDEGAELREFLLRGGFLMVDDFHGSEEWAIFQEGLEVIFPDRMIEDLPANDPIFHMLSDIDLRIQVPGEVSLGRGGYEKDGITPRWRGIRDDHGRVIVAICHNMDLGDAWEHSDDAWYPADMAVVAHHVLQNYATYNLTH
ncbi:MAG: DUF4159 domain-containing protein [Acidobacteriota bacterium]